MPKGRVRRKININYPKERNKNILKCTLKVYIHGEIVHIHVLEGSVLFMCRFLRPQCNPSQVPTKLVHRHWQNDSKIYMKRQRTWTSQNKEEEQSRRSHTTQFQDNSNQDSLLLEKKKKNRCIRQRNRAECPEIAPQKYNQLSFDETAKAT